MPPIPKKSNLHPIFLVVVSLCSSLFFSLHHFHQPVFTFLHLNRAIFALSIKIESLHHLAEGVADGIQHILHPTPTRKSENNMAGEDTPEVGDQGESEFVYHSSPDIPEGRLAIPSATVAVCRSLLSLTRRLPPQPKYKSRTLSITIG